MKRIYKVIWSKVKHQYVVTSEFAHSCTKSTGGRISRSAAAVLAALVLTMGVGSVQANYTAGGGWIGSGRDNSISIGDGSNTYDAPVHADNAIAIGHNSFIGADANGSIAIGFGAQVASNTQQGGTDAATDSIAIGYNAKVTAEANNSVAFGANSKATEANTFSIGSEGNERKLVNMKDGEASTDGATVGQMEKADQKTLNESKDYTNQKSQAVLNESKDYTNQKSQAVLNESKDYTNQKSQAVLNESKDYTNQKSQAVLNESKDYTNQKSQAVLNESKDYTNQKSQAVLNESKDYTNQKSQAVLNESKDYTNQKSQAVLNESKDYTNQKSQAVLNESKDYTNQKSQAVLNESKDYTNQKSQAVLNESKDYTNQKSQAVLNESKDYTNNQVAIEKAERVATDEEHDRQIGVINAQIGAVSETDLGLTNGEKTLVGGINANSAAIAQNRQDINNLNHRVDNLDSRIDKVGAGAAALAALHPLDFDPDAKWDFAAGYGNYNGENAVAVGTFYRPNEDTMFSVGGTFGNGENMINAGVSLKIGAGSSHVTTSRVAMAKEIKSMRDIVAKQDAQIQKLTAMVNALVGVQTETDTTTMFPDVPENHWAYEAVAAMAKSGLVKGYPDGEFKGDRNMTRYEFAQIVYNAIQAGAEVDARLVEEFKPELEYFHIATVAKDKDGNPTIERVRAN